MYHNAHGRRRVLCGRPCRDCYEFFSVNSNTKLWTLIYRRYRRPNMKINTTHGRKPMTTRKCEHITKIPTTTLIFWPMDIFAFTGFIIKKAKFAKWATPSIAFEIRQTDEMSVVSEKINIGAKEQKNAVRLGATNAYSLNDSSGVQVKEALWPKTKTIPEKPLSVIATWAIVCNVPISSNPFINSLLIMSGISLTHNDGLAVPVVPTNFYVSPNKYNNTLLCITHEFDIRCFSFYYREDSMDKFVFHCIYNYSCFLTLTSFSLIVFR